MRSAVTISLVPEARGGPFVFWDDLAAGCRAAAELGFDGVEIFPPGPEALAEKTIRPLLQQHNLSLAAVGTGAGWVKHHLTLTDADASKRTAACEFVRRMIDATGPLGAPVIIGSMQGRFDERTDRPAALARLGEALGELGDHARQFGVPLVYEPLNRYETNLCNTIADGVRLIEASGTSNVTLLADLFHLSIEEADLPAALRAGAAKIGHVHLADSNRRPAGAGHTSFGEIAEALADIRYDKFVSAECLPLPDSASAARRTIDAFNTFFRLH